MRKHYLDNIRWITIVSVVIFHIYFYYNNIGIEAMFTGLPAYDGNISFGGIYQYFVYPWFMLLLFVVAGISARSALQTKTNKEFLRARVDKVLVPSTLGVLVFGWIGGVIVFVHNASVNMPAETPVVAKIIITLATGIGALWFCHVLFVAVLVLILIRTIIKKCKGSDDGICLWITKKMQSPVLFVVFLAFMFFILWGGSHILNMPMITSYRNGIYIPAFLMGYYVFSNESVMECLKKCILPMLILTIITGTYYIYSYYGLNYSDVNVLTGFALNLYAFCMVLLILGAAAKYLNKTNSFMSYMSKVSFGIYVFHIPVMLVTNYLLVDTGLPMFAIYVIELISGFAVSLALYEVIHRIPFLRYWILGIRKPKAKVDKA